MSEKIRVGILFGGASDEREISLASGLMIAEHLPRDLYEPVLLDTLSLMASNPKLSPALRAKAEALRESRPTKSLPSHERLSSEMREQIERAEKQARPASQALERSGSQGIDVAFLALHGKYGEDGTLQGLLELFGVPYTGSGVLASALAMDKSMAKRLLASEGIPVPRGVAISRNDANETDLHADAKALTPAVVKPSKQGSSVGMTLVTDRDRMDAAITHALAYDDEVLIEERIVGTEVTVGVVGIPGSREIEALPVVEIVPKREFFDYQAKYDPSQCDEICPARLSEGDTRKVQDLGVRSHQALGCRGYSRTDIILGPNGPVVLEVNTLPGMTINSLLPKAAAAAGIPFGQLLHRIITLALEGHAKS